jgi:hypothetical protein
MQYRLASPVLFMPTVVYGYKISGKDTKTAQVIARQPERIHQFRKYDHSSIATAFMQTSQNSMKIK